MNKSIVIVPCYNESNTIASVVSGFLAVVDTVLVIDDCSADHSQSLAESAGAVVVRHATNLGYEQSLETGFNYAFKNQYSLAITADADGQHPVDAVSAILSKLHSGDNLVLGRRATPPPRFSELVFSFLTRYFYGISDPTCGLKGYNLIYLAAQSIRPPYLSIGTRYLSSIVRTGSAFSEIVFYPPPRSGTNTRFGYSIKAELNILFAVLRFFL